MTRTHTSSPVCHAQGMALEHARRRSRAYTLIEALLMVVILSIISIPVGNALVAAARNTEGNENTLAIDAALVSQMENLRATYTTYQGSVTVTTPYTFNTSVTVGNSTYTCINTIQENDPSVIPLGSGESDVGDKNNFLTLTVQMAGRTLNSYVSN